MTVNRWRNMISCTVLSRIVNMNLYFVRIVKFDSYCMCKCEQTFLYRCLVTRLKVSVVCEMLPLLITGFLLVEVGGRAGDLLIVNCLPSFSHYTCDILWAWIERSSTHFRWTILSLSISEQIVSLLQSLQLSCALHSRMSFPVWLQSEWYWKKLYSV